VDLGRKSHKEIGNLGEEVACEYLKRNSFRVVERNVRRKTGEIDIVARYGRTLHFVEVKTILCEEFPEDDAEDTWGPEANLHQEKIRRVARTGEWYVANTEFGGEWEVDGILVWIRKSDGLAKVGFLPHLL
jgi:putative endonuclease